MSLPVFLRFAYNHGTEEVIRRGKRIFHAGGVQFLDVDHLLKQVRFRVRNDQYQNYYTVTVSRYNDEENLAVRCQCPYNLGEICRHEVAALFQLNDMSAAGFFDDTDVTYDQQHTLVRMRQVSEELIGVFTSPESMEIARQWAEEKKVRQIAVQGEQLSAEVPEGVEVFPVQLRQNDERYFDTSCSCDESSHPLCRHKAAVFLQVLRERGTNFFRTLQNWDAQKEKLLSLYGYSLKDDLNGKFDFVYQDGKPILKVLDPEIKKINTVVPKPVAVPTITETVTIQKEPEGLRLGIVLEQQHKIFPGLNWRLVAGEALPGAHKFTGPIEAFELHQYINLLRYPNEDRDLPPLLRKLSPEEIVKYLRKNLPFGDLLDDYNQVLRQNIQPELAQSVWEYLLPRYQRMLTRLATHPLCFLLDRGKSLSSLHIEPVGASAIQAQPVLRASHEDDSVVLRLFWEIGSRTVPSEDVRMLNAGILLESFTLHAVSNFAMLRLVQEFFSEGSMKIPNAEWPEFLENKAMAWRKTLPIRFDNSLIEHSVTLKPTMRLYLSEREGSLILRPALVYGNTEIRWGFEGDILLPRNGRVQVINRQIEVEDSLLQSVRNLHSDMKLSTEEHFFYLASDAVLAGSWFFRFMDEMREKNIAVLGLDGLKRLRVNAARPKTEIKVSSGIDWFDTEIQVAFGEQHVSIADIKKALQQQQHFVALEDGSIGLLPEEWLQKYSLLVKMGESHGNKLRLKKFHFSVLDALLAEVDEETIQQELEEKKEQLSAIIDRDFSDLPTPVEIKADLRPYQHAGFQWMQFLRAAGWGGILADDMGLGKTVQTLATLQQYSNEDPDAKFLVVCPTTLMYNWEAEIKKFSPELSHYIHHGPKRTHKVSALDPYRIIITSYGTLRSDIKWLREITFDYVVLDESQAIKNPQSQVAKASLLIQAKHKLALSGTPVQNNTFDLYAQMNFLNPGLLGSREFFSNEFATPIDKFREEDVTAQLRQLIYPFMLRRTKEQVARDLPEKTETILYCEMGPEQRKIYNAYRNSYKDQILGMIDQKGIERSQLHILQGLTRLRQICDSPAILNEEEKLPNHSIKSEELIREINENVGHHKALVFSQFLGMLAIIRQQLEEAEIPYVYFDGSTSATDRAAAIQEFQENEECRVFLISLKAGGVGLNLTAADYVYIVDPWWNPAVEQQAIDRTHRIGQTKNIFAYRLICKDTIEEKMLILQERKKALAADLVSDDSSVMKKLTRDDIAFLLS
jgi:non-specific serine/threonine protein kinase